MNPTLAGEMLLQLHPRYDRREPLTVSINFRSCRFVSAKYARKISDNSASISSIMLFINHFCYCSYPEFYEKKQRSVKIFQISTHNILAALGIGHDLCFIANDAISIRTKGERT